MLFPTQVRVRCFKGRLDPPKKSPGYFSVRSLRRPKFNFHLPQASFHPHAPLVGYFSKRGNLCSVSGARVQYVLNKKVDFRFPLFCQFISFFFHSNEKGRKKSSSELRLEPTRALEWLGLGPSEMAGEHWLYWMPAPKEEEKRKRRSPPIISLLSSPSSPKAKHWIAEAGKGRGRHQGFGQKPFALASSSSICESTRITKKIVIVLTLTKMLDVKSRQREESNLQ